MLEKDLQAKLLKKLLAWGALAAKVDASKRGWPDITAVLPGGQVLFLEVKTAVGRLSPHQIRIHSQLQELGAHVHTIRSTADLDIVLAGVHGGPAGRH